MLTNFKPYQDSDEVIADLNKHFKTIALEKYPQAVLNYSLEEAFHKEFKNRTPEKISDNSRKRIIYYVLKELQSHYGEWVNLYNFDRKFRGHTNFEMIYKTEFGRLYGNRPGTFLDHLFYTAHSFEKFKERYSTENFKYLRMAFQKLFFTDPNSADYLRVLTLNSYDFCETEQFIYVNVHYGILVVEKINDTVLVVKTYLCPEMDYPKTNWFRCHFPASMLNGYRNQIWETDPPEPIQHTINSMGQIPYNVCRVFIDNLKNIPMMGY
jgi:hypothetical protein